MAIFERESPLSKCYEYAFKPEDLLLSTGEYASKKGLQVIACRHIHDLSQGISTELTIDVPPILNPNKIERIFNTGKRLRGKDPQRYMDERVYDHKHVVYGRGVIGGRSGWLDPFLVDIMPSREVESLADMQRFEAEARDVLQDDRIKNYLRVNFGINTQDMEAEVFYQPYVGEGYVSVWELDNLRFAVLGSKDFAPWATFRTVGDNEYSLLTKSQYTSRLLINDLISLILPVANNAGAIFNRYLPKSMGFKHDFIFGGGKLSLIQSRPTHFLQENLMLAWIEQMNILIKNGIKVISKEIGDIENLAACPPIGQPYVLKLTNDKHRGALYLNQLLDLDLSNLEGLFLPEYLQDGMLAHGAWSLIARSLLLKQPLALLI